MSICSTEVLQGTNWSVERSLVDPSTAEAASLEVLEAIATRNPRIHFDFARPKFGFSGYLLGGLDSLGDEELHDPLFCFPSLVVVRDAIKPFKDIPQAEAQEEQCDEGYVNIIARGGRVPLHRDSEPWSLVFVGLAGVVMARVKNEEDDGYSEVTLSPGDAFKVVNPKPKKKRPKHELINMSKSARVSYGEYTTQRLR